MTTRQLFIVTIAISLAGHIVVLALTGLLGIGSSIDRESIITFDLQEQAEPQESMEQRELFPAPLRERALHTAHRSDEDTVDLDSRDTPYAAYLLTVRKRIRERWSYPGSACKRREEGTTVMRFSIREDGKLVESRVIVSSGHESLDSESFHAVTAASPFTPLPAEFNLTQLHIVARFQYVLDG